MGFGKVVCDAIGAAGSQPVVPATFGVLGDSWLSLTFTALFASLFILVLIYIFSQFLRNQVLIAWTKFELFQIFGTAAVVIFSIIWIHGFCTFDMSFLDSSRYPQGMTMEKIIERYFGDVQEIGYLIFSYMLFVAKYVNLITNVTWPSNPLGVGSVDSPLQSFSQINSLMFLLMSGYVTSFLLLQFQMRMVEYLAIAGLYFLYPFGIFFRAFEPTRPFGGTLIGLTIAMFFFYPVMLVFNDYLIWHKVMETKRSVDAEIGKADQKADPNNYQLPRGNQLPDPTKLDPTDPATESARNSLAENVTSGFLFLVQPIIVYLSAAVVLPVINFIVLVEITRGLTHFLGEEIDVTNLTRMI
ncbi:MAG: hypothetical protein QXT25_02070 [Candidatus Anstonellaceae archaeon]